LRWYHDNKRSLPWRHTPDPYRVWLSEIILQQTRVAQGLPYYQRFINEFPTLTVLARAPEQRVLRLWQGLGYYSRARNLHKCAQVLVAKHQGSFPHNFAALKTLPGIGPYTAAAIASIAFGERVAVVDGNVFRVLARIFGIATNIASPAARHEFSLKANSLMPPEQPGNFNQAMMEFGATWCTPKKPNCADCIFATSCFAYQHQQVESLPVKQKKTTQRHRYLYYIVFRQGKNMAMRCRIGNDIWKNLYDFYLIEHARKQKPEAVVRNNPAFRSASGQVLRVTSIRHVLTHQVLHISFIEVAVQKKISIAGMTWFTPRAIKMLPKPVVVADYLEANSA